MTTRTGVTIAARRSERARTIEMEVDQSRQRPEFDDIDEYSYTTIDCALAVIALLVAAWVTFV